MKEKVFFSSRVLKIIAFINENFTKSYSVHEISFLALNLSASRAERIFKKEVGLSIKKFLILKRICEAAHILRLDPKLSELDVLYSCGYDDVSNFIKQFKKHFGCTPVKFRNCDINPENCILRKKSYFYHINGDKIKEALGMDISKGCFCLRIKKTKN